MKWLLVLLSAIGIALLVLALLLREPTPETPATAAPGFSASPAETGIDNPPASLAPRTGPSARELVILDNTLQLDQQGNLIPSPDVRELFDDLARQQHQIPADLWKQTILNQYADQLGPTARQQLQTLLDRYIEFNLALQMLPMDGVASLTDALDRVAQLRDDYLGADSAPLFSDWQQMETFSEQFVQQVTQSQDAAQLQQSLQEQLYALPNTVQPRAQKVLQQSEDLFQALAGGRPDPATLKSIAEQLAAQALIQPDFTFGEPTQEFMMHYLEYSQQREALLRSGEAQGVDDPRLNQLRQSYFSGSDTLRAKTLDRAEMY